MRIYTEERKETRGFTCDWSASRCELLIAYTRLMMPNALPMGQLNTILNPPPPPGAENCNFGVTCDAAGESWASSRHCLLIKHGETQGLFQSRG